MHVDVLACIHAFVSFFAFWKSCVCLMLVWEGERTIFKYIKMIIIEIASWVYSNNYKINQFKLKRKWAAAKRQQHQYGVCTYTYNNNTERQCAQRKYLKFNTEK